ncbi:MAG: hypothetical protein VW352_02280 [Gammaproteobacteria bacterium]|jgi:hypothetical protein|nr:hypothetical protein [Gammaproteobacteria bacterium]NCW09254.1 hypothetical protein [Gammaproteobacteria bacterium]NCW73597.1 hypothetical protein [Gammaproteobacteria bacterium]
MRLLIILLASFSLTACSMIPESWKFDTEFWTSEEESVAAEEETVEAKAAEKAEPAKEIVLELDADQLAKVEVGQTKDEVLEILGPSANVDDGETLADHYVKGGEVYDVLYFRAKVNGVEDIRALLFKANQLVGIGWSEVN